MDLNKVMLIGNVTKDPQMRTLPSSGQTVTNFSIATNRRWKDKNTGELKEDTQFHNIVVWGKLGEILTQYTKKGSKVFIEGRLQTRSWDDQQTGQKKYMTEVMADNAILLDRKGAAPAGNAGYQQAPGAPVAAAATAAVASTRPAAPANNNVTIPAPDQIPTIDLDENQEEIRLEDIPF